MKNKIRGFYEYNIKHMSKVWMEKAILSVVWKLPRSIVFWCAIRVGAEASSQGNTPVPDLTMMDALERFEH